MNAFWQRRGDCGLWCGAQNCWLDSVYHVIRRFRLVLIGVPDSRGSLLCVVGTLYHLLINGNFFKKRYNIYFFLIIIIEWMDTEEQLIG